MFRIIRNIKWLNLFSSLNLLIACIHIYRSEISVIRYILALLLGCSQDHAKDFVTLIPQQHMLRLNF